MASLVVTNASSGGNADGEEIGMCWGKGNRDNLYLATAKSSHAATKDSTCCSKDSAQTNKYRVFLKRKTKPL